MAESILNIVTLLVIPVVFIVAGLIQKNNPPKTINHTAGFRTKLSMESQENWDYANKQIGIYWARVGLIELVISIVAVVLFNVLSVPTETSRILSVVIVALEVAGAMIPVNMVNKKLMEMSNNK